MTPTKLYRHFDASGRLLYVGIAIRPTDRLLQHIRLSTWADSIARIDIETHASRDLAVAAEATAIEAESPLYNKRKPTKKSRQTVGRPTIAEDGELMRSRPLRMTQAQWDKCKLLGGAAWVRKIIEDDSK